MLPDHYQALGVGPQASREEVRGAYLHLMRTWHPDRRPGDRQALERSLEANAAWEVLGDRARRAAYDRLRATGAGGPAPGVRHVSGRPPRRRPPAYSAEGSPYRRAFHRACVKAGSGVFALGLVLLLLAVA